MFIIALLVTTIILTTILAAAAYTSNPFNNMNRSLAFFTAFIGFWALGVLIMLHASDIQLARVGAWLFYVSPLFTTYFLVVFAKSLPYGDRLSVPFLVYLSAAPLAYMLLITLNLDWILDQIVMSVGGVRNEVIHHLDAYSIYNWYFNVYLLGVYGLLVRRFLSSSTKKRKEISLVMLGITASSLIAVTTNLYLPLNGVYSYVWIGPSSTLIFTGLAAFSIVRHKFLNVRFLVARSIAYLLLLSSLAIIYSFLAFGLINGLFKFESTSFTESSAYVVLAVFVSFSFQPLKRFFDRLTNKYFYRDNYNQEKLLREINKIFISSLSLSTLTKQTTDLIVDTVKSSFVKIALIEDSGKDALSKQQLKVLRKVVSQQDGRTLVSAFLDPDEDPDAHKLLSELGVAVVVQIEQTAKANEIGYLLVGGKKSGSAYSLKDIRTLQIIGSELAIAIQNSIQYEKIKQFSDTLQGKVEDATKQLRQKNAKLKELDQAKDDFISMASHQLRTPLTTVKGYLSMLDDGDFGKLTKKQKEIVELTFTSSERMVYLIADLLNVSRINTGKFMIERTEVNLNTLVEEEVKQLQRNASAKGLKLTSSIPKKALKVWLDETKTRQVIMNFIDNALYYTKEGTVHVELNSKSDCIEFTVTDTGIGVPEKAKGDLFTKFFRAENARKARPDGTGLGLFMAKKVITAQGGSVIFESSVGEGSTFGFRFSYAALSEDSSA